MIGTPATPLCKIQTPATPASTPSGPKVCIEKILVTIRMRPLNGKEHAMYDLIAWDCIDNHMIVFKNPNLERPTVPYTFDKVFDPTCSAVKVYEEGAKDVALSALNGINATIFAYGQTGSGKTFTMKGIAENAVQDIYEHIENNQERDFVLKFSALEIYNETVVDLLNRETGSLRLLDDPQKGTIVEKLVEEVVQDIQHMRHLIGICEAQRQMGETALNDNSSRSHQIIRLTIKSSFGDSSGCMQSFVASLNLVDLAGSERVSQTNADGVRLKEGSHINRSLLTLTTVIRKLSGGKRIGHIPYRDSKLTRILQHSLGGNARTAIICTINPALSDVEQTRNTLSFATSAKEVTNKAQVNMKKLVRLEAELQSPDPSSSSFRSLSMEKELKIEQLEKEMKELKCQRDLAQSQLEQERKAHKERKGLNQCWPSPNIARCLSFPVEIESGLDKPFPETRLRNAVGKHAMVRQSVSSTDPSMLVHEIRKLEQQQRQLVEEANQALEVLHSEVALLRLGSQETAETIVRLLSEIKDIQAVNSIPEDIVIEDRANLKEELTRLNSQGSEIASLEGKLENVQKSIDILVSSFPRNEEIQEFKTPEFKTQLKKRKARPFFLCNSANVQNTIRSQCAPLSTSWQVMEHETENKVPENNNLAPLRNTLAPSIVGTPPKNNNSNSISSSKEIAARKTSSVDVKKLQRMFKNAADYVTELKERVAKLQYQKQLLVCQVLELEANDGAAEETDNVDQSPMPWHLMFEEQRKQIIILWHLCHVSIIHRSQFYLLLRGDPTDQIHMEVELRRLTRLEQHFAELSNACPALLGDQPAGPVASSIKALKQEREFLAKRVSSKLTADERELIYMRWDIPPVGKQRRLQLVNKLWTDPLNMQNVQESAELIAQLAGFCESGEHANREMFELNFANRSDKKTWMGWNLISNLLHLQTNTFKSFD